METGRVYKKGGSFLPHGPAMPSPEFYFENFHTLQCILGQKVSSSRVARSVFTSFSCDNIELAIVRG